MQSPFFCIIKQTFLSPSGGPGMEPLPSQLCLEGQPVGRTLQPVGPHRVESQ